MSVVVTAVHYDNRCLADADLHGGNNRIIPCGCSGNSAFYGTVAQRVVRICNESITIYVAGGNSFSFAVLADRYGFFGDSPANIADLVDYIVTFILCAEAEVLLFVVLQVQPGICKFQRIGNLNINCGGTYGFSTKF